MNKLIIIIFVIILSSCTKNNRPAFISYQEAAEYIPGKEKMEAELARLKREAESEYNQMRRKTTELVLAYSRATTSDKQELDRLKNTADSATAAVAKFESEHQDQLWKKEMAVTQPGLEKLNQAISKVCKDNNYAFVMDISEGKVIYYDPADNIMNKVKKELQSMK